ncbi:HD-GYP domain-containing protein [Robertmurraya kyonggiensis]|uniref:HD-GYP domain-containing protein n=2 Tax=Robertmurraya kyonggiensis TaxID=1037680 RepID=A0A4U1DDZ2_9BACI|nr:HD-GYP domain-containing protein [Robertmurraya kyonggiensis]
MTISEIDAILESMKEYKEPIHQLKDPHPFSRLMIKEITKEIDVATIHMKELFHDVGNGGELSLEILHENIFPTIKQAAKIPHLYHLFYELNEKDEYTYRHTICVGIIATMIGKWLNLPPKDLNDLTLGATLHDIGKAKISTEILHKPGKLTKEEYDEMKLHTIYGYELLKNIDSINENVALIALQHHEREDGKGYPLGLAGHQISYLSKIVAVADVFHAMSSERVYHRASPFYAVMKQMQNDAFGKLDPNIVLTFMNKIMNSLVGKRVLLTDQSVGTILMIDPYDPIRCLIQTDERLIDLRYSQSIQIEKVLEEV